MNTLPRLRALAYSPMFVFWLLYLVSLILSTSSGSWAAWVLRLVVLARFSRKLLSPYCSVFHMVEHFFAGTSKTSGLPNVSTSKCYLREGLKSGVACLLGCAEALLRLLRHLLEDDVRCLVVLRGEVLVLGCERFQKNSTYGRLHWTGRVRTGSSPLSYTRRDLLGKPLSSASALPPLRRIAQHSRRACPPLKLNNSSYPGLAVRVTGCFLPLFVVL